MFHFHKWAEWGEPKQWQHYGGWFITRRCEKCGLLETRRVYV
jgi:hypothetical protein